MSGRLETEDGVANSGGWQTREAQGRAGITDNEADMVQIVVGASRQARVRVVLEVAVPATEPSAGHHFVSSVLVPLYPRLHRFHPSDEAV